MQSINLVLKDVKVNNVNMLNGLLVAGFPSICSFVGFANAIAFDYGQKQAKIAIINNGMNYNGDQEWNLFRRFKINGVDQPTCKSEVNKKSIALSGQSHCLSTLNCSLYISIYTEDATNLYNKLLKDLESGKLLHLLKTKFRLCSGQITDISEIKILENVSELIKNEKGFVVIDRNDLLNDSEDLLSDSVEIMYKNSIKKENDENNEWLSLNNLGYSLLTELKNKNGVRENKKHAFVEPIFGFIEYIKPNKLKNFNIFWEFKKQNNAYICQNIDINSEIDF